MKKQKVKKLIMFIIFVIVITLLNILINIPLNMETTVLELKQEVQPQSSRGKQFTLGSIDIPSNLTTVYDYDNRGGFTFGAGLNKDIGRLNQFLNGEDQIIADGGIDKRKTSNNISIS